MGIGSIVGQVATHTKHKNEKKNDVGNMRGSRGRGILPPPPWKIEISLNYIIKLLNICLGPPPPFHRQIQITFEPPPPPWKFFWIPA